jgi:hypothetical protein
MAIGMVFLVLRFLLVWKAWIQKAELPIDRKGYKLDRTYKKQDLRIDTAILSQANKGIGNFT